MIKSVVGIVGATLLLAVAVDCAVPTVLDLDVTGSDVKSAVASATGDEHNLLPHITYEEMSDDVNGDDMGDDTNEGDFDGDDQDDDDDVHDDDGDDDILEDEQRRLQRRGPSVGRAPAAGRVGNPYSRQPGPGSPRNPSPWTDDPQNSFSSGSTSGTRICEKDPFGIVPCKCWFEAGVSICTDLSTGDDKCNCRRSERSSRSRSSII